MKTYIMIAGVNGAGESSFTGALNYQRANLDVIMDNKKPR